MINLLNPISAFQVGRKALGLLRGKTAASPLPVAQDRKTMKTAISQVKAPTTQPMAQSSAVTASASRLPVPQPQEQVKDESRFDLASMNEPEQPTLQTPFPVPEAPKTMPSESQTRVRDLAKKYAGMYAPSEDESRLESELTEFKSGADAGISGLAGQGRGIPLSLVRGKQAKLQEQAGREEQTMLQRIANARSKRTAEQQALGAELGFEREDLAAERADATAKASEANKTFEVGNTLGRIDPATGKFVPIYSAPEEAAKGFSLSEGQAQYDAQGNLIAQRGKTFAPGSGPGSISAPKTEVFNGQPFQWNTATGQWDAITAANAPTQATQEKTAEIKNIAQELLDSPSLNAAVGPVGSRFPTLTGGTADVEAKINRLKSLLTIDNLKLLKGAMSDKDLLLLQSASTALTPMMSDQGFRQELQKIVQGASGQVGSAPVSGKTSSGISFTVEPN